MVKRASGCCCWFFSIPLVLGIVVFASLVTGKGPVMSLIERYVENSYEDPIMRAFDRRDIEGAKKLIASGHIPNRDGYWHKMLIAALPLENRELIGLIKENGGDPTQALQYVNTVEQGKELVRMGAKVDAGASYGDGSLLAYHVRSGDVNIVEWLLKETPNAKARAKDYTALVAMLKVRAHEGVSQPYIPNSQQIITVLKRYGAKE
ncbi:hypothetical protein LBMAG21_13260 [Armatimonadota bacterium]|nr:hypothetical protein LBMAG21_13260 [Armatimonadota bacterium]